MPAGSWSQFSALEVILTFMFILMITIINLATGAKEKGIVAGVAIGAVVPLEALYAGPVSGASMNPARSIAPALVSGNLMLVWIFILALPIGAIIAFRCCRCTREGVYCKRYEL